MEKIGEKGEEVKAGNYYYRNSTSDNVLWTAQNLGDNTNKKLTYTYNFTGNLNNNFMFTLGTTGNINTTTGNPSIWGTGY